jgi:hypothetical protein
VFEYEIECSPLVFVPQAPVAVVLRPFQASDGTGVSFTSFILAFSIIYQTSFLVLAILTKLFLLQRKKEMSMPALHQITRPSFQVASAYIPSTYYLARMHGNGSTLLRQTTGGSVP